MTTPGGDRESDELVRQQKRLEKSFRGGWVRPAREPVTFSEQDLARIDRARGHGGFLNEAEHEYLQRLRAGARRGEPLPAAAERREPYIRGLGNDFELMISTGDGQANVVIVFSHDQWPGVRFGHRLPAPDQADGYEAVWLMEEIETGALDRLMAGNPSPDPDGIIWTDWANR